MVFLLSVVQCPQLNATSPLMININSTTYQSVANYTCEVGYNLMGNASRFCQEDMSWSGNEPECRSKDALSYMYERVKSTTHSRFVMQL